MVKWLIEKGSENLDEAFVIAAEYNSIEVLKWFFEEGKVEIDYTHLNETALYAAARGGHKEIVIYLLKNGADPFKISRGETPLNIAALYGRDEIIEILLAEGVPVDIAEESGYTPLWSAISGSLQSTVDILLKNGADNSFTNKAGYTIATWAKEHKINL